MSSSLVGEVQEEVAKEALVAVAVVVRADSSRRLSPSAPLLIPWLSVLPGRDLPERYNRVVMVASRLSAASSLLAAAVVEQDR